MASEILLHPTSCCGPASLPCRRSCSAWCARLACSTNASAPLGAMMIDHGPDIGERSPTFKVTEFDGTPITVGRLLNPGRPSLLMFTGPTCPICAKLLPIIRSVAAAEGADVVLISDGTPAEHKEFLRLHPLQGERYVVSAEIGMRFQVAKIPYGVLLDGEG